MAENAYGGGSPHPEDLSRGNHSTPSGPGRIPPPPPPGPPYQQSHQQPPTAHQIPGMYQAAQQPDVRGQQPGHPGHQMGPIPPPHQAPHMQYLHSQPYGPNPYAKNNLGVISLIMGIIGLLALCLWVGALGWLGLPLAVTAVITGHLGRKAAREGSADNAGLSLAGLVMGYLTIAIDIIPFSLVLLTLVGVGGALFAGS